MQHSRRFDSQYAYNRVNFARESYQSFETANILSLYNRSIITFSTTTIDFGMLLHESPFVCCAINDEEES